MNESMPEVPFMTANEERAPEAVASIPSKLKAESKKTGSVKEWLIEIDLPSLVPVFEKQLLLEWDVVKELTLPLMQTLDIPLGLALKFMRCLKDRQEASSGISLPNSTDDIEALVQKLIDTKLDSKKLSRPESAPASKTNEAIASKPSAIRVAPQKPKPLVSAAPKVLPQVGVKPAAEPKKAIAPSAEKLDDALRNPKVAEQPSTVSKSNIPSKFKSKPFIGLKPTIKKGLSLKSDEPNREESANVIATAN